MQRAVLFLCGLLPATRLFCVLVGQKIQLTGYDNNGMRNATFADKQTPLAVKNSEKGCAWLVTEMTSAVRLSSMDNGS